MASSLFTTLCPFLYAIHSTRHDAPPSVRRGSSIDPIRIPLRNSLYSPKCRIGLHKCHVKRSGLRDPRPKSKGDPMSKLREKVALVTGGSRGLGAAVAEKFAAGGASGALTYRREAKAAFPRGKTNERHERTAA